MTINRWRELAELISEEAATWVNSHGRFLRNLHFGDDGYNRFVLQFFRQFLGERSDVLVSALSSSASRHGWKRTNPQLHAQLYEGASVSAHQSTTWRTYPMVMPYERTWRGSSEDSTAAMPPPRSEQPKT